jgi:hypothetical protein
MKPHLLRIRSKARLASLAMVQFVGAIVIELRRLNRARLDSATLAGMGPRERRKAVKAALAAHYHNSSRCC